MKKIRAFTLIELLVVIAILAVLSALVMVAIGKAGKSAARTNAINNMKQLGVGFASYIATQNSEMPFEGEAKPTWESATDENNANAWYNVLPKLAGGKGLADYANDPVAFYQSKSLLFNPAAQYPEGKKDKPLFAFSYNSKLRSAGMKDGTVRFSNIDSQNSTVIFQECGVPGETLLPGQAKYDGQSKSYANRSVTRHNGRVLIMFANGHIELKPAKTVVNPNGEAYFPQLGGDGEVLWTLDPNTNPNE